MIDMDIAVRHTSMLVHVSLLRALNSFMSTRCAASAMVPFLPGLEAIRALVVVVRQEGVEWAVGVS